MDFLCLEVTELALAQSLSLFILWDSATLEPPQGRGNAGNSGCPRPFSLNGGIEIILANSDNDSGLSSMPERTGKKYQVFVSSTYTDLENERSEVIQDLLETGGVPTGMELFPVSNKGQWQFIKKFAAFRKKLKTGRLIKYWDNKDNLKAKVLQAFNAHFLGELSANSGWIRATGTPEK
ncbi:MAG: DUF4062 domain-containing protein [Clostridiales Family XIII bacterium]|jgi:hypothetical protein|nr:DUF4062 domain-containing protein [Clostridiales Family XIII bacterium]